jgi:glutathione S-transferase
MITVHHLENSRSQRVLWLLEELGTDYEIKHYKRDPETSLAPAELKSIHPLGKSPVVTDGEFVIAETGAIIEYLVDNYGNGRLIPPPKTPERLRYTYWMHAGEGTVMPLLVMSLIFNRVDTVAPWIIRPIAKAVTGTVRTSYLNPNLEASLAHMESELGTSEWFAGDEFTAADVAMSFPLEAAAARGGLDAEYPKLSAFLERIHRRPAYVKALERGGPYSILTG